ncbi:E3 ubiquitin-protein ligase RNF25 [Arctopsyche grandis]|uniref:E3 ubiquitin-protein ligase RNF25 n=1 Tax=Arctopsyche grandis TaxID=121162 RepID=UPI00406D6795
MASVPDERVTDEIEALEAILIDDVIIHRKNSIPTVIETVVHPSTGDDTDQQYVCVTLEVLLTSNYPDTSPNVKLRNPRGLDDSVLDTINAQIQDKLLDCLGQPVVFELIELIRENLTNSNLPSGQCVICLYSFLAGDAFTKTQCYHHFHSHCLSSHLVAGERNYIEELEKLPLWQKQQAQPYQPTCPVCREPINCDATSLGGAPPPRELSEARNFELTSELRDLQERMATLYQHQQSRGGIIDLKANRSKLLLLTGEEGAASSADALSSNSPEELEEVNGEVPPLENDEGRGSTSSSPQSQRGAYRGPFRGYNRNRGFGNRRNNNHNNSSNNQGRGRSVNGSQFCTSATR